MELRVFDKTVQPLGAIDELPSLIWHTKYFDVGTFSLLAPITDNNSRLLVEGNLITKHDGKKEVKTADGGVWRRAAQITYVHITKDENGLEHLSADCGDRYKPVSYKPYGKEQLRQRSRNKAAFSIAYISGAGNHRRRGG